MVSSQYNYKLHLHKKHISTEMECVDCLIKTLYKGQCHYNFRTAQLIGCTHNRGASDEMGRNKGMSASIVSDYDHEQHLIQSLSLAALLTCHSAEMRKQHCYCQFQSNFHKSQMFSAANEWQQLTHPEGTHGVWAQMTCPLQLIIRRKYSHMKSFLGRSSRKTTSCSFKHYTGRSICRNQIFVMPSEQAKIAIQSSAQ